METVFNDTIVAIATPLGEAGLGVIRLSGPQAMAIASRLFQSREPLAVARSHTLHHGWIVHEGVRLDEAVASVFRAPHSYTGEDVVEFSCHGSPAVLRELLRWCCQSGARLARPGEFTERAYTHGRLDLAQAEAVAALISAGSAATARVAAHQLAGGLSRRIDDLRQRSVNLLADIEANLDFVEDDIPNVDRSRMIALAQSLAQDINDLLSTSLRGRILREGARVALAGRPNVGKSSLFNALLADERAIVTDVPGTTRDILEERLSWDGVPLILVDTAGLRETTDRAETAGRERAQRAHRRADVIVLVLDASEPLTADDRAAAEALIGKPVVVALNKKDRGAVLMSRDVSPWGFVSAVAVSALNGEGLTALRSEILACLPQVCGADGAQGVVVINERHAEHLREAETATQAALQALHDGRSEEAIAEDLRRAAGSLAAITGVDAGEAVLDSVFRRFCVGK